MESAKRHLQVVGANTDIDDRRIKNSQTSTDVQSDIHHHEIQGDAGVVSRSKSDFIKQHATKRKVKKAQLINKINYINFRDDTILINFKHLKYDKFMTLKAVPNPCVGDLVDCLWSEGQHVGPVLHTYKFDNILIINGSKLIKVAPELIRMDEESISLLLPETGHEISARRVKRHTCEGIKVQLIQNSTVFLGSLLDFNGYSFRVNLKAVPPQTFDWMNPEHSVNVMLSNPEVIFYAGECKIIRHTDGQEQRNYILQPLKQETQRFKSKEFRSERYELVPSPNIVFQHPFTGKRVDLKVVDLSGSGFSVEEDASNTALLPGMILPELELNFAGSLKFRCTVQVVFRKHLVTDSGKKWIKCGLALLDMDSQDHIRLIALLHQTKNKNSYICNNTDLDALWDFFFETGFIYPDKYAAIQKNKNQIKETYAKLYTRTPQIARHFIYQDKGVIHGHMAMLRFYENAWMIHHHAARKSSLNKAGLIVLDQIGRMGNDSHRLRSLHMDYMICYYRPENKFPSRVFGGAVNAIKNPKGCSLDSFAYFHVYRRTSSSSELPGGWKIAKTTAEDLRQLSDLYEHTSGGLMLDAIDLTPDKSNCDSLSKDFEQAGLIRQRQLFSLTSDGHLKAIFMVNHSNVGLNLSDITSCVKVFVIDSDELGADMLHKAIASVADITGKTAFPTLLYPVTYADEQGIEYEKIYNLWVVSLQQTDEYFRYLDRLLRFV